MSHPFDIDSVRALAFDVFGTVVDWRGSGLRTAHVHRPLEFGAGVPRDVDRSFDLCASHFLDLASQLGA